MTEFDPYEHLLRNFSKHKFKAFIEDSFLNLDSYDDYDGILALERARIGKEHWDQSDYAYIDAPNKMGIFLDAYTASRWLFRVDHMEDGLIKPEITWELVKARIQDWVSALAADDSFVRQTRDTLYGRIGTSLKVADKMGPGFDLIYGQLAMFYFTNAPIDPSDPEFQHREFAGKMRSIILDRSAEIGVKLDHADFALGVMSSRTFLIDSRDRYIKAIEKLEARPDSLQLQFVEGRIRVTPVNQRRLYVYGHSAPRPILLDQAVTALPISEVIKEFEQLLNPVKEAELQKFLEAHPAFLLGLDYDEIKTQVTLNDELGTVLRPDFFLRPTGKQYWDILDIKRPHVSLLREQRNRERLSDCVQEGVSQLMNYARFFDDASNREKVKRATGIDCLNPRLTLVIGQKRNVDEKTWNQVITQQRPQVEIVGFDELLDRTRKACALWQSLHV